MFPGIVAGGMRGGVFDPLSLFASGEKGFHLGCVHDSVLKNQSAITGPDLLLGSEWSANYPDRVTVTGGGTIEFHDNVGDAEVSVTTSIDTEEDTTYMLQFEANLTSGVFYVMVGSTVIATVDSSETAYVPFVALSGSSTAVSINCTGGTFLLSGIQVHEMDLSGLNLFQDADGVLPVTRGGQPIGGIRDQSTNVNNFQGPTTGSSVTILQTDGERYYLYNELAGGTRFTSINNVELEVDVTVCVALSNLYLDSGQTLASIFQTGTPGGTSGFGLAYGEESEAWSSGSNLAALTYDTPLNQNPHVFTLEASISDDHLEVVMDSLPGMSSTEDQGTGAFGSQVFSIGLSVNKLRARMYTLPTVVGRLLSPQELSSLRRWHQERTSPPLL